MKTSNKLDSFESNPPIWSEEAEEEPKSRTESISNRFQISRPSLLSFDNTIQNVSIISFLLGCSFGLNLMFWYFDRIGIYHQVHLYLFVLTIFHLLEFLVTAIWNHSRVTVSSFLLNNGSSYYYAHLFSLSEFIITQILSSSNPKPSQAWMPLIGLMLIIIGQSIRTLSMMTAAQSFNHQVSTHPHPQADHVLIINGIYSYLRHPAYFGFFWWSIGLQIYLNNRASLLIFTIILWKFFNHRIQDEEMHLIKFFGKDYLDYKTKTRTHIPFIR